MLKNKVVATLVTVVTVLLFGSFVTCEPPAANSGWGQQQNTGAYSSGYQQPVGGYSSGFSGGQNGGWAPAPAPQAQSGGGGWGQQQQQQQAQSGGWGQAQAQQQQQTGGWGQQQSQNQMKGQSGWTPQLSVELDTGMLKPENLNPAKIFRSLIKIPGKIVNFIRDSGLYLLFIPLIIILPLMLLAFNFGRTVGGLSHGWGWHGRSLVSSVEKGLIGYMKSPVWQKIGETLMDEKNFELIMKSIEEFRKDW